MYVEYLEKSLAIIGVISTAWFIVRLVRAIFGSSKEWHSDIIIKVDDYNPDIDYDEYFAFSEGQIYPEVYKDSDGNSEYMVVTYFIPQGRTLYDVKIKRIIDESIDDGDIEYITEKVINGLNPQNPLCVIAEYAHSIPRYIVEWKTQYGGKATYYFNENRRDGRYGQPGVLYHYSLFSKIRRFLDI